MTTQQLISELQKFPPDKEIVIPSENGEYFLRISEIEKEERFIYFDNECCDCFVLKLQQASEEMETKDKFDFCKFLTPERILIGFVGLLLFLIGYII